MIAPVQSLAQLRAKANKDPKYRSLAILAANNFGYTPEDNYQRAMSSLHEVASETSEDEVIEEVNSLRSEV
jgi:hypothetical protein